MIEDATTGDAGPTAEASRKLAQGSRKLARGMLAVLRVTRGDALPAVTLSWAQSATGAIAAAGGARAALSGLESLELTHLLRAGHDAILVGIRTVLSDDPLLSVRLVDGPQPQPVILDSGLRFPHSARLLSREDRKPWIFHAAGRNPTAMEWAARELSRRGARLFPVRETAGGLDLVEVLRVLRAEGIRSVLVEGGARVLHAFLDQGLALQAIVTVSPSMIEGIPGPGIPALAECSQVTLGPDTIIWGRLARSGP
jgi:riboflavin-specific deaminase-like protein